MAIGFESEMKDKSYHSVIDRLSSKWVITSSINGPVSDGPSGKGSPFANSIVRTLLKCNTPNLSISDFFFQLRKDVILNYSDRVSIPGLGILSNSSHEGGEFCFKLKKEFIIDEDQDENNRIDSDKSNLSQNTTESQVNTQMLILESLEKLKKEFLSEIEHKHKELETRILQTKQPTIESQKFDRKKLNSYIANDEIDKFFEKIDEIQDLLEKTILIDLINLQSQWRAIENQRKLGILDNSTESLTKNKIRRSLIEIINQVPQK